MQTVNLRMGEFPRASIGAFDFRGEDFQGDSSYFGLHLQETYLIAHLRRKSDGRDVHITRPLMLYTSSGLSFSTGRSESQIYQDPRSAEFLRGGIFVRAVDSNGALVLKSSTGFWSGGVDLSVEAHIGDTFSWEDSGKFSLRGRLLGPGMQTYVPSRRGRQGTGVCHTGTFYEGEGTVFGEPVSGILIIEHVFCPPGEILADSSIRRRFAGGWNGFASVFEDGSTQHGHFAFGAGPFRFANIMDGERHIACGIDSIKTETDPDGLGRRIEYQLANGETWEFATQSTLMDMLAKARAAGSTVQVHKGYLGRVGEQRRRRNWYSIQEWVPERLRNDAQEAAHGDVPRGF